MRTTQARRALGAAMVFCSATPTFAQGDALEPNDVAAEAVAVTAPLFASELALSPTGGPNGDVDRFALPLAPGDQIRARLLDPGSSALDPLLLIADPSGAVVASSEGDAGSRFPLLYFTAPSGGTYQVIATGAGDLAGNGTHAQVGAYGLELLRIAADALEPNDARAQAAFAPALPASFSARLEPADVDWYALPAAPGARVIARLAGAKSLRGAIALGAFDANGTPLGRSTGGAARFAGLEITLAAGGPIFFAVSGASDAGFTGAHALSAPYELHCAEREPDRFEPNSSRSTATLLAALPFDAQIELSAGSLGDVDWYRFGATRGDQVRIRTSDPGVLQIGTRVGLFRASNGFRVATTSVVSPSDPFSELVYRTNQDGDLVAAVTGRSDDDFIGNHNEVGPYDLRIARDLAEPNDEIVLATALAAPAERTDLVMVPGDVDWFRLDLPAGSTWHCIAREVLGPQPQIRLGLFDALGRLVRSSDGAGGGGLPELLVRASAATTYYLGVTGVGDTEFQGLHVVSGGYDLSIEERSLRVLAVSAPSAGIAGASVEIVGENFTTARDMTARFAGMAARVLSVPSSTRLWLEVPALGASAQVGLEVAGLNGSGILAQAFQFVAAQPLLAGQSFAGSVTAEADWLGFALLEGTTLDLDLRGARQGGLADPALALFDPSFAEVDVSSLLSSSSHGTRLRLRRFEIPAGQSGTWYVRLSSLGASGGAYELKSSRKIPAELKRPAPTAGAGSGRSVELGFQVESGALLSGTATFQLGTSIETAELLDAARQPIPGAAEAIEIFPGRAEVRVGRIEMPAFGDAVLVITGPAPEELLTSSFSVKFPKPKGRIAE